MMCENICSLPPLEQADREYGPAAAVNPPPRQRRARVPAGCEKGFKATSSVGDPRPALFRAFRASFKAPVTQCRLLQHADRLAEIALGHHVVAAAAELND